MGFEDVLKYCVLKLGAFEDFPFGPEPSVIKVSNKMFALISTSNNKVNLSLKCDPIIALTLREQYNGVTAGYHLNKKHWNTIICDEKILEDEVKWMIDHSYNLVFKALTKVEKNKLNNYFK